MKCKQLIMSAAVITTFFSACKKDKTVIPVNTVVPEIVKNERLLLVSASTATPYSTYTFSFNADKSVKKVEWGNGTVKKEFFYNGSTVTAITSSNGKKTAENIYELSNGIAQKQNSTYYDANGSVTDKYVTTFKYNTDGLLEKVVYLKNGADNGSAEYQYNNKELKVYSYYNSAGILQSKCTYEYDPFLEDKSVTFTRFNTSGDNYLFPRLAKHVYNKTTTVVPATNTTDVYTFSYAIDAKGYITKQVTKNANGVVIDEINNTWE